MSWRDRIVRGLLSKGEEAVLQDAYAAAERRAAGGSPIPGLPREPQMVQGEGMYVPGPIGSARDVAERYMAGRNFGQAAPAAYRPLDKSAATRTAEAFEALPMHDPAALSAYDAMIRETLAQYQAIKNSGLKITPVGAADYPYGANPRAVAIDVGDRGRMSFFKSEPEIGAFGVGTGENVAQNHPLLRPSG